MDHTPAPPPDQLDDRTRKLVEDHQPVVRSVANHVGRRLPPNVDKADLVQDGMLGLMEALLRWTKESSGSHFENYIALRAQGAMIDGLRAADPASRQVRKDMRRVEEALQALSHQLGRAPTEGELAQHLQMPLAAYQRLLQDAQGYVLISLQDLTGDSVDQYLKRCEEDHADPLVLLERAALRRALAESILLLPRKSQILLTLYYEHEMRMHEIATHLGLSEARISQMHTQSIAHLRASLADRNIQRLLTPRMRPREAPDDSEYSALSNG
jgi:RNA polymerase sigma factor for flagellar operon FliA